MDIHGIIVAMATPMRADGALDVDAVKPLVDRLIENGAHGVFAAGSMGEAASLAANERLSLIRATVKAADGRIAVIGGTGFITTKETVEMTRMCKDEGLDAVSVITPYYWKLTQEALYKHYAEVIAASSVPVFAYNLPGNTGNNLDPETVGKLYRQEGLSGAKDSSAVWENTKGYMDATDDGFTMLVGEDSLCFKGLAYGSKGSISAPSNVMTYVMAAIYNRFTAGDIAGAEKAQADWGRVTAIMNSVGRFPGSFKALTDIMTSPVGPARAPVLTIEGEKLAQAKAELEKIAAEYK